MHSVQSSERIEAMPLTRYTRTALEVPTISTRAEKASILLPRPAFLAERA